MIDPKQPIALAITGASGSAYGLRLLELLIQNGRQVYLMISKAGEVVIPMETGIELPAEICQIANSPFADDKTRHISQILLVSKT